ncbi:MAG: Ku protein [Actinomycetia bacterium]|nr:Ku protein [Actinomycetes bacterium]
MATTIWTGSISFGLVTVPVRLVPATKSRDVSFHQLEEGTGSRIRYKRISEASGEEVSNDQIVKGYDLGGGQYVVMEPDELAALAPKASKQIEIEDFVDLDQIDPLYFENPYYVVPDKNAAKPYQLLVRAMEELHKVAIGRVVLRSKERLVAIRPLDGMLCIEMMRYADEVLPHAGLAGDEAEVSERELKMAEQLIQSLASDFEPEKYHDEYREQLLDLIDRKAAGEEIVAQPQAQEPAKVLDLMAALEASLARASGTATEDDTSDGSAEAEESAKPKRASSAKKSAAKKSTAAAEIAAVPKSQSARKAPAKATAKKAPAKKTAAKKSTSSEAPAKKRSA